ncbi:hypothetical protein E2C01_005880 [Portunus trituberculatus]|uniref:Uncharacterized protein n=1 Tax=Portunus trituberculatus TaxID=210409 RepID=A0A5B7CUL2_PORTR|nr:hypothetical protein [Portunus trituberculatus]
MQYSSGEKEAEDNSCASHHAPVLWLLRGHRLLVPCAVSLIQPYRGGDGARKASDDTRSSKDYTARVASGRCHVGPTPPRPAQLSMITCSVTLRPRGTPQAVLGTGGIRVLGITARGRESRVPGQEVGLQETKTKNQHKSEVKRETRRLHK